MKRSLQIILAVFVCTGFTACQQQLYIHHHAVRMVDAKSYLDHPVSASLYYYK